MAYMGCFLEKVHQSVISWQLEQLIEIFCWAFCYKFTSLDNIPECTDNTEFLYEEAAGTNVHLFT